MGSSGLNFTGRIMNGLNKLIISSRKHLTKQGMHGFDLKITISPEAFYAHLK